MRASGQFTQGEITRAFRAWQTALEAIDPSPLGRVAAAGYKTRDELQAAANDARTIWETMVQSGRFTADEIQRAWEDWQDKLEATGTDGLTKKVRDELKSLKDYVATEVPEFDELGNRIFGVEEQRAIDRIAEIEAQVAASQAAIQTATGTAGTEIEGAMEDAQGAGEDAFEAIESGAEDAALKAKAVWQAGSDLQTLFAAADYETPFEEGRDAAERMRREVDLLQRSVDAVSFGRSPGGLKEWSPMLTAAALTAASASDRMVSDYDRIAQAVNRVTFGSGSFEAGLSTVSTVGPLGFGSAGVSGEANALTELRAIRRALSEQQPDVLFVPLKPGDSMQSLEDRLADQLPRRIMQSASFRNAMQRAINGGA
jgi:hypothetical protein